MVNEESRSKEKAVSSDRARLRPSQIEMPPPKARTSRAARFLPSSVMNLLPSHLVPSSSFKRCETRVAQTILAPWGIRWPIVVSVEEKVGEERKKPALSCTRRMEKEEEDKRRVSQRVEVRSGSESELERVENVRGVAEEVRCESSSARMEGRRDDWVR